MKTSTLVTHLDTIGHLPGGVEEIRRHILQLAVSGRLVDQRASDTPLTETMRGIEEAKNRLIDERIIAPPRHPQGVAADPRTTSLPPSWRWLRLGDVGAIVGGGTPSSTREEYWSTSTAIPWLTPADMRTQSDRYITRGARDITPLGLAESSAQLIPAGSVLFSSRAPIGHVGIAAAPLATNQGFKSCVPYLPEMAEYLYLYLLQAGPQIEAEANGTTFKEVSGRDVALIQLALPPIEEQARITEHTHNLLKLCDEFRVALTKQQAFGRKARRAAFRDLAEAVTSGQSDDSWRRFDRCWDTSTDDGEWTADIRDLARQLAVRGHLSTRSTSDEPVSDLLADIAKTTQTRSDRRHLQLTDVQPLWAVPPEWTWTRLGSIVDFTTGKTPSTRDSTMWSSQSEAGAAWATIADMPNGGILTVTSRRISLKAAEAAMKREPAPPGTLLMSFKLTIGKVCRLGVPSYFNEAIIAIETPYLILDEYLFRFLPLLAAGGRTKAAIKGQTLNSKSLANIPVPLPPLPEQERLIRTYDDIVEHCAKIERVSRDRSEIADAIIESAAASD